MWRAGRQTGTSFVEVMISLTVFSFAVAVIAGTLIDNSRINTAEQMRADIQANARNCVSLIAQRIRTAGWDPQALGFQAFVLDADPSDDVSYIELYSDLDGDGLLDGAGESVQIRHQIETIDWRLSSAGSFVPLAVGVPNDTDGDGVPEPMFVVDAAVPPTWIRIRVTAESSSPDPRTGQTYRYTVETEVALRGNL